MTYKVGVQRPERNATLAWTAARQWGNLTRQQIIEAGVTDTQLREMVRRGELLRMHRGVYALGHRSPAPEARWAAALLAAGPASVLSHTGSAAARGLMTPRHVTEVTTPTQRRGDERLAVHRAELGAGDVEHLRGRGLRLTSVPRMLLELAAAGWPVDRLTQDAAAGGHVAIDDLRAYAQARRSDRGGPRLLAAVEQPHVRSRGEQRLLAFLRRRGLPVPEMNAKIGRLRVDAFFEDLRLAVELDPEQTHGSAHAARQDAWRDAYLTARGIETLRIEAGDLPLLAREVERRYDDLRSGRPAPET